MSAKLLRLRQVQDLVPWSRATIWRKENTGEFPKRRPIGPNTVAWVDTEIHAWIKENTKIPEVLASTQNIKKLKPKKR